jgi:hypothetical protein
MCVLIFSTIFVRSISHYDKHSATYYHKRTQVFMYSTPSSCQIPTKLKFSPHIFKKHSNIRFHETMTSGSRVVLCWRTDRHDEAKGRFSQFYAPLTTGVASLSTKDCLTNKTKLSLFGRRYRTLAKFCNFEEYLAKPWKKL